MTRSRSIPRRVVVAALAVAMVATAGLVAVGGASSAGAVPAGAATGDIVGYAGGIVPGPAPATSVAMHPGALAVRGSLVYMGDSPLNGGIVRVLDTTTGSERVVVGTGQYGFD